jgi:hypothetical protein
MVAISNEEMEIIKREVEKEFPFDPALQQVHMARKIISKEAEKMGMDFFDYIRSLGEQPMKSH